MIPDPTLPPVTHDIMLRALRGEYTPRVPCWAMRQAGRYLPEFRALRARADFFTVCNTPELCVDATLQPLRRFISTLDAVVIFSDILITPQAMGLEVRMEPGPVFPRPLASPADFSRLTLRPDAATAFAPLYEGISRTRRAAAAPLSEGGCGKAVPVIGFCGAPWTLMSYMVAPCGGAEGAAAAAAHAAGAEVGGAGAASSGAAPAGVPSGVPAVAPSGVPTVAPAAAPAASAKRDGPERTREWLYRWPAESHTLLAALADVCIDLLVGAWRAGASVLQVFESAGGELPPRLFDAFALPYLRRIAAGVRARTAPVEEGGPLLIAFARCAHAAGGLEGLCDSAFDALSLDWGWDPAEAARRVAAECKRLGVRPKALQGNLDPAALFAPLPALREAVRDMLEGFGPATPLVANLGHGMLPGHVPEALGAFFDAVHEVSAAARKGDGAGAGVGVGAGAV